MFDILMPSDLYDAFEHILNNASGVIRREIERLFVDRLSYDERETLATIVRTSKIYASTFK